MSDAAARLDPANLPDDAAALKTMLVAERGVRLDLAEEVTRLTAIVDAFKRAMFGRRSEKLDPGSSSWRWKMPSRRSPRTGPSRMPPTRR